MLQSSFGCGKVQPAFVSIFSTMYSDSKTAGSGAYAWTASFGFMLQNTTAFAPNMATWFRTPPSTTSEAVIWATVPSSKVTSMLPQSSTSAPSTMRR